MRYVLEFRCKGVQTGGSGGIEGGATMNTLGRINEPFRDKILRKCGESVEMKEKFFNKYAENIEALSRDMAERFSQGHKLLTMGNGGSLCDALHFAVEFTHPIIEKRAGFPAISLMTDIATMTAVGNDADYSHIFVDQLRLLGHAGDMALAVSTSGKSPNLIYALEAAREKQLLTIAWAGKDGGRFPEIADYCFIVPSYSIHRIQEVHATLVHVLWDLIHLALGAEDVI
ncbi:MAG: D-sedoheptulose-7-phosphate isomerase [Chthoniobacterales bacterium]